MGKIKEKEKLCVNCCEIFLPSKSNALCKDKFCNDDCEESYNEFLEESKGDNIGFGWS